MIYFRLVNQKFYAYLFFLMLGISFTVPSYADPPSLLLAQTLQADDVKTIADPENIDKNLPENISEIAPDQTTNTASNPDASNPDNDPNARLRLPVNAAEGLPIQQVFIYIRNPPQDAKQEQTLRRQLADTFGVWAGGNFSPLLTDQGLNQVQRLPSLK